MPISSTDSSTDQQETYRISDTLDDRMIDFDNRFIHNCVTLKILLLVNNLDLREEILLPN